MNSITNLSMASNSVVTVSSGSMIGHPNPTENHREELPLADEHDNQDGVEELTAKSYIRKKIDIVAEGDLITRLISTSGPYIEIQIGCKVLRELVCNTSEVFKMMLNPSSRWYAVKAEATDNGGIVEVLELRDDDLTAMLVLLRAAHHKHRLIPTTMTYDQLMQVALCVDKYNCTQVLHAQAAGCFERFQEVEAKDLPQSFLFLAQTFGRGKGIVEKMGVYIRDNLVEIRTKAEGISYRMPHEAIDGEYISEAQLAAILHSRRQEITIIFNRIRPLNDFFNTRHPNFADVKSFLEKVGIKEETPANIRSYVNHLENSPHPCVKRARIYLDDYLRSNGLRGDVISEEKQWKLDSWYRSLNNLRKKVDALNIPHDDKLCSNASIEYCNLDEMWMPSWNCVVQQLVEHGQGMLEGTQVEPDMLFHNRYGFDADTEVAWKSVVDLDGIADAEDHGQKGGGTDIPLSQEQLQANPKNLGFERLINADVELARSKFIVLLFERSSSVELYTFPNIMKSVFIPSTKV